MESSRRMSPGKKIEPIDYILWGAKKMQGLKKRTLPDGSKTKPEGWFLTKKGSSPEWHKPKMGFWSGKKPT